MEVFSEERTDWLRADEGDLATRKLQKRRLFQLQGRRMKKLVKMKKTMMMMMRSLLQLSHMEMSVKTKQYRQYSHTSSNNPLQPCGTVVLLNGMLMENG